MDLSRIKNIRFSRGIKNIILKSVLIYKEYTRNEHTNTEVWGENKEDGENML